MPPLKWFRAFERNVGNDPKYKVIKMILFQQFSEREQLPRLTYSLVGNDIMDNMVINPSGVYLITDLRSNTLADMMITMLPS